MNIDLICKFTSAAKTEANISDNYRGIYLSLLCWLSRFHNDMDFRKMKKNDIIEYLDHLRKDEVTDPLHRWIGTYNLYIVTLTRFLKWFYHPDLPAKQRPKPQCVDIAMLRRKE